MATSTKSMIQIRWLIRRDMPEVLEIERLCFQSAWTEEDFVSVLRKRNAIGMVAEANHSVLGFMIYELHKSTLGILNFAVLPSRQRQGVGRAMVDRLKDKLSQQRRRSMFVDVRETNLDAQLFFQRQGFWATEVLRSCYDDTDEDGYRLEYEVPK